MYQTDLRNLTITSFQGLNQALYGVQNDIHFSPAAVVSRLHRYSGRLIKAVRKDQRERAGYYIAMAFSWAMALANKYHIDLEAETWKRFPGVCPYCGVSPCCCKERAADRQPVQAESASKPASLHGFQLMFAMIYQSNTLEGSVSHLAEEISEIDEAVEHFSGKHESELFEEIKIELVDVVANLCAVATCLGLNLKTEIEHHFTNGCPGCQESPCECGYTTCKTDSHGRSSHKV